MIKNPKFTIIATDEYGNSINLTEDLEQIILEYDGFEPPIGLINTSEMSGHDGCFYNSSRLQARNIVLSVKMRKDAQTLRQKIQKVFKTKKYIKLSYKDSLFDVFTEGYVETMELARFSKEQTMQISILCPDPYLYDSETDSIPSQTRADLFEFPFSIASNGIPFSSLTRTTAFTLENEGDAEIGLVCTLRADGSVVNPKITNASNGEYLEINDTLADGDIVVIDTRSGKKKITKNGTNIMGKMTDSSSWVKLLVGTNLFGFTATSGSANMVAEIEFTKKYVAV